MRVVIDTNILVSFAIRPNSDFEKIFDHVAAQGVFLISEDTLAELPWYRPPQCDRTQSATNF
jgi:predicted nucleic acid-binding protein